METFKDEIKNLKAITRVIAALVLANFVIIALVVGPDSVGYDPTYGPITAILSFVIAFLLIAVMMVVWFRNFASGLVSMLPNVFPAAVIFGWMGWTDRIVDIGSMMTAHATARPIKTAADIASGSQDAKELFFFDMMAAGIWIARRGFVALNIMIGDDEGDRFVAAVEEFVAARKALLQPK